MIHRGFAELTHFTLKSERYDLRASFFINHESLLVGNQTKVLIRPNLTINGRKASMEKLKNCSVVISTMNYIDKIPVTHNFQDL